MELYRFFSECDAVTTDSRDLNRLVDSGRKVIFFALKGENFDGNKFALPALGMGACYAVADDKSLTPQRGLILVDNVLESLTELATYHRKQLSHTHLAITGSNGKTTTKELICAVLNKRFRCHATSGNLNNHIGVPLTILRTPNDANFSIIEMGANHRSEIAHLTTIAQPEYGLITNIGKAHLEGFGGGDGVKRGKGELFDYLEKRKGTAFYLLESEPLCELAKEHSDLTKIPYSIIDTIVLGNDELLSVKYNETIIHSQLVGDYNAYNIRAAIAIGEHFGVSLEEIKDAIENYIPSNSRSQMVVKGSCRIVVDAYNANPSSMELSITNFDHIDAEHKVLIIGDMKELGDYSLAEHISILQKLEHLNSSDVKLYFVGSEFHNALQTHHLSKQYEWFKDASSLAEHLRKQNFVNKLILIKGSNSTRLFSLIECF